MRRISSILLFAVACGGPTAVAPEPSLSVADDHAEAMAHEQRAAEHDAAVRQIETAPESYRCGDTVVFDQSTSGGERLTARVPCWSAEGSGSLAHQRAANRERVEAERHRAHARQLVLAEQRHCAPISPDERNHTPFWHTSDILAVERLVTGETLRGARISFRHVPSLTATWMEQSMRCQRARAAALGWNPHYMGYDPTLFEPAKVVVYDRPGAIVVDVVSGDPDVAAVIAGRAQALLGDDGLDGGEAPAAPR